VFLVPEVSGAAVHGGALTLAGFTVPEEVVGAESWEADAFANRFVENFIYTTQLWRADAFALFNVENLTASFTNGGKVSVTDASASGSAPNVVCSTSTCGFSADATADFGVKIVSAWAYVWFT